MLNIDSDLHRTLLENLKSSSNKVTENHIEIDVDTSNFKYKQREIYFKDNLRV